MAGYKRKKPIPYNTERECRTVWLPKDVMGKLIEMAEHKEKSIHALMQEILINHASILPAVKRKRCNIPLSEASKNVG